MSGYSTNLRRHVMDPNNVLESESIPAPHRHGWIDYIPRSQNFWAAVVVIFIIVVVVFW